MISNMKIAQHVLDSIMDTKEWAYIQWNDPEIKDADAQLDAVIKRIPEEIQEELRDSITDLWVSYANAAVLYGMRVAYAIRNAIEQPFELSRYSLDRKLHAARALTCSRKKEDA